MDKLIMFIKKILHEIKTVIYTVYNNLSFLFNKQKTLQKIYQPIIEKKLKENQNLKLKFNSLKVKNKDIQIEIERIKEHNQQLQNNIRFIKDLIVKNKL